MEKTERETVATDNSGFERRKPNFNREVREGSENNSSNYRSRERQGGNDRYERRSFNPNFDENNRVRGSRDGYNRDGGSSRPYQRSGDGQNRSYNRNSETRSYGRDGERLARPYNRDNNGENRSFGRSGERSFNNNGDRPQRSFNRNTDRPYNMEGSGENRPFARNNGERSFNKSGDRPERTFNRSSERPYNRENSGENRSFNRTGETHPFNRNSGDRSFGRNGSDRPFRGGYNRDGENRPFNRDNGFGGRREFDNSHNRESGDRPYRSESRPFNRTESNGSRPYGSGQRSFDRGNSFNRPDSRNRDFNRESSFGRGGERRPFGRDGRSEQSFGRGGADRGDRRNFHRKEEPVPYISEELNVENELLKGDIRLNRYISMSGVCSRRDADELITSGRVTVNGEVVTELGSKVSANDVVAFDGEIIRGERNVYILMNKPKDYITTLEDPNAEKIVTDLLNGKVKERVYPVGRLDKNSLGVLILTNDGEFTKIVTHPSFNKKKIYHVTLDKPLQEADMEKIATGIELEDGFIFADEISCDEKDRREVGVEIHSGRNRIVRRMFEHVGYKVRRLDRVYFAGLTKKGLQRGEWRYLTQQEVESIKKNNN